MKTVIMAGGKGTRISSIVADIPKPMIPIAGIPVLEREICCLRNQGFKDIIITVSYLADCIIDYFRDGKFWDVNIEYFIEDKPLGNAGALFKLREKLTNDFLLLNADSVFDVDFNRFTDYHKLKGGLVTLFTHPNSHPYDSGLIIAGKDGKVEKWLAKEDDRPKWYRNRVNAGLHIMNTDFFDYVRIDSALVGEDVNGTTIKVDLDRQILKPLCDMGKVFCYDSPEYVKDMGTPERYSSVCQDYLNGVITNKNLKNKQKAIFLDRDGTLNKDVGFLSNINDLELLPDVSETIKKINESEFLAIIITNQPVVARGDITEEQLNQIHNKLETLLGDKGAYVDAIYYCPHHPDKGFKGEIPELKFECDCRKPKPGMIFKASKDYNIDLSASWMIGDSEKDIIAGRSAGCKTALIGNLDYGQDVCGKSIKECVEKILI